MEHIPISRIKGVRKRVRRLENDRLAREARFWKRKIKSADRMLYDQPVNEQSTKVFESDDPRKRKFRFTPC